MQEYLIYKKKNKIKIICLFLITVVSFFLSLSLGRYMVSIGDIFKAFTGGKVSPAVTQVIFTVRLPRIIAGMMIGSALSLAGAAYQGMFKNPLVSPDILGASAGSGFGAAVAILFSFGVFGVKVSSFLTGLAAVLITWFISDRFGKSDDNIFILILGGIIVSSLFQSLISLVKYSADPTDKLPEITFWLMGSLSKANMKDVSIMIIPFVVCVLILMISAGKLNILSMGEDEAKSLGINTKRLEFVIIITATVLTAFSVSLCGMIGWVGLVIPHLCRMFVGPDFKVLMPAALFTGAAYLVLIDDVCRCLFQVEIPLGIVTSLAGLPFFLYLLGKKNKGW